MEGGVRRGEEVEESWGKRSIILYFTPTHSIILMNRLLPVRRSVRDGSPASPLVKANNSENVGVKEPPASCPATTPRSTVKEQGWDTILISNLFPIYLVAIPNWQQAAFICLNGREK